MNRTIGWSRTTALAALIVPGAAVLVARLVVEHRAPASAAASGTPTAAPTVLALTHPELTDADRALLGRVRAESTVVAPDRSPFYVPRVDTPAEPPDHARAGARPGATPKPAREHTPALTSIFRGKELMATIDGTLRRVGDRLPGNFTLVEIDPTKGAATIDSPTNGRVTLLLQRPRGTGSAQVRARPLPTPPPEPDGPDDAATDEPADDTGDGRDPESSEAPSDDDR